MKNLQDFFKITKAIQFLALYTNINPLGGIQSRVKGKSTNSKDKRTEPTQAEIAEIKAGLVNCANDMLDLSKTL